MSIIGTDQVTRLAFSMYENKGVYALLLGSGLSRSAQIPTGWEITLDLVRRVAAAQGIEPQADWAAWHREKSGNEPNYSDLLAEIAGSPDERRAILHSYIESQAGEDDSGRKLPTPAHRAIADLVKGGFVRVLITTNFDRLLEQALRERGIEPTVVSSVDALQGAEPLTHTACYLLKLHGDYKDARILNTDDELSTYPAEYNALLDRILDEHGLVVAGWSGAWDHALRAAVMRVPGRRYSTFWCSVGEPNPAAQELIAHRRGTVLSITDADSFFTQLRDRVETLQQTHRQSPQSVELAVAAAKRFVAKPEFRIQLDDLVLSEALRLGQQLASPELADNSALENGEGIVTAAFQKRAAQFEAATEPLAKVLGVLGRWGDGSEFHHVYDLLQTIYRAAEQRGSRFVAVKGLQSYPAVLVYTAYALGLCRAGRWETLHRLFSTQLTPQHGERRPAVEVLQNYAWAGATDDIWKRFPGQETRAAAFSDLQLALFEEWSQSFVGLVPDLPLLFGQFEVLGGMAFAERFEQPQIEAHIAERGRGHSSVWFPLGRARWDSDRLLEEVCAEPKRSELVAAGFGKGDAALFDLYAQALPQGRFWG